MVDGDVLRMSEAADIAELLAARFARASRPTKVVLQKSLLRPLLPLLSDVLQKSLPRALLR